MKNKKTIVTIIVAVLVVLVAITLVLLIKKKDKPKDTMPISGKSDIVEEFSLKEDQQPYISLTPQADGHRLTLKITNIPSMVNEIEYDLIYTAQDESLEIEKGIGGTAEIKDQTLERDLLLGTESCTNGCKYKYDEGITGGILILNLLTKDNKSAYFEAPFVFKNASALSSLALEDITITTKATSKNEYFILIKNYQSTYSVFSSANGSGTVSSIEPSTITKEDMTTITGDYLLQ
jgi:hypothetical protein